MDVFSKHMAAIKSGKITRSNVIGLRKIINAAERMSRGYSTSPTAPAVSVAQAVELERALHEHKPRVVGELHESGLKLLRSPRNAKALAGYSLLIEKAGEFRLVRFDRVGRQASHAVPVYQVCETITGHRLFTFRNIPWQTAFSLGEVSGPQIQGRDF